MVVIMNKIANHPLGILECERSFRPDGLFFEGAMITFQFTVTLWVIGRAQDVGALPQTDKLIKVFGHELRPIVADNARASLGINFPCPLDDNLGIGFPHLGADVPGQDGARSAIEY